MVLSKQQKQELYENGFIKVPGLVPLDLVRNAMRAINVSLGTAGTENRVFQEHCNDIASHSEIMDLALNSPVTDVVRDLIHPDVILPKGSQIALRFPRADAPARTPDQNAPVTELVRMMPHIDGVPRMPTVPLPEPVQVCAQPGDVTIANYLLGHGVAEHLGPDIRYTIYFRFNHPRRAALKPKAAHRLRDRKAFGFSVLIGVQLSELSLPDHGNLVTWGGSHRTYAEYFRQNPAEAAASFDYPDIATDLWGEWAGMSEFARAA